MEPEKGKVQATWKVGAPIRSQPAIEGGRIYVGTQDGKVVCIDTGDARLTGWSTWGANAASSAVIPPTHWPGRAVRGTRTTNETTLFVPAARVSFRAESEIQAPTPRLGAVPDRKTVPLVCPVVASTG